MITQVSVSCRYAIAMDPNGDPNILANFCLLPKYSSLVSFYKCVRTAFFFVPKFCQALPNFKGASSCLEEDNFCQASKPSDFTILKSFLAQQLSANFSTTAESLGTFPLIMHLCLFGASRSSLVPLTSLGRQDGICILPALNSIPSTCLLCATSSVFS